MRFKEGSRVEILSNEEMPTGSWLCAEILSGNRQYYTVRYEVPPGSDETIVERVTSNLIRPCPPLVELADDLILGEILEIFHNFSWKMATVSKILNRNLHVVRLVGSSQELKARKSNLRVRQCWHNGNWTIIGKGSEYYEHRKQRERLYLKCIQSSGCRVNQTYTYMYCHAKNHNLDPRNNIDFLEPLKVSSRALKRGSPCWYTQMEAQEGSWKKFIASEKEGRIHRVSVYPSTRKVEPIASTTEVLGEKHINAPLNNRAACFVKMDEERKRHNGFYGYSHAINLEPTDANCSASSVGSCSVTSSGHFESPYHSSFLKENEGNCSEAESFCHLGCEELCLSHIKEELAEEIHRLELHAYRCTIKALHSSGPLSWEQETLVTNLRMSLHISNDEHLMELKNLISTATRIPIS